MPDIPRRWHAQAEAPSQRGLGAGCALPALATVAAVALMATLAAKYPLLTSLVYLLVAASGVMAPALHRGPQRTGIAVDQHGLRECYRWRWGRRVRWDQIRSVALRPDGATVQTARGPIELDDRLDDWQAIAGRCFQALGSEMPPSLDREDTVEVPAGEVVQWLGVADDEILSCVSNYHQRFHGYVRLAFIGLFLLVLAMAPVLSRPLLLTMLVLTMLLLPSMLLLTSAGPGRAQRLHEVRAGGAELDVRTAAGWRRQAWSGLRSLARRGQFWVVETADGELWLPPELTNLELLLHAIRQAIDARSQGLVLPRMTADVPAAALSLSAAAAADGRGLSRADEA
jgi:hypothetical protein